MKNKHIIDKFTNIDIDYEYNLRKLYSPTVIIIDKISLNEYFILNYNNNDFIGQYNFKSSNNIVRRINYQNYGFNLRKRIWISTNILNPLVKRIILPVPLIYFTSWQTQIIISITGFLITITNTIVVSLLVISMDLN